MIVCNYHVAFCWTHVTFYKGHVAFCNNRTRILVHATFYKGHVTFCNNHMHFAFKCFATAISHLASTIPRCNAILACCVFARNTREFARFLLSNMAESNSPGISSINTNELRNSILARLEMLSRDITDCTLTDFQPCVIEDIHDHAFALYRSFAIVLDRDADTYDAFLVLSRRLVDVLQNVVFSSENHEVERGVVSRSTPGRPKFEIPRSQLLYLIDHNFNAVQIAKLFGISLSTVRRRMQEQGLDTSQPFTPLTENELDNVVRDIKQSHPKCGYRMVIGHLRSRGLKIQQHRVRASLRRVDPEGSISRWMATVSRRMYSVKGPNSLWHIDGYHKLVR